MHTDPIADMLTRIRNAQMVKKSEVVLPYSKLKLNILNLLSQEGWIGKVEKINAAKTKTKTNKGGKKEIINKFDNIRIELKYNDRNPHIRSIKRISKPGQRVYVSKDNLPTVLNNLGISVISTSKGLLTNKQAKKEQMGGEVICEVY